MGGVLSHPLAQRAMSGRREIAIGLGAYAAYLAVRQAVWTEAGRARARRNARRVIALERRLGLFVEPRVQAIALRAPRVVDVLNAGYAAGNVALSVGWLMWLYGRGDSAYRRERRAAVVAFAAALPVFLVFPTAPPRTEEELVDTLADRGIDLDHPVLVRLYNPIAAMPSHHVAFAVVTGTGLAARASAPAGRLAWLAYAPLVTVIVIATGNHFIGDVVAGAALGVLARYLTR
jgi:membrane-associated phospholipid phosphatase